MRKLKDSRGFTLAEMLITVAIIIVLAAVAFINVPRYQRSMEQLELDGIAREIFVTAQNHLTMADSQGFVKQLSAAQSGTPLDSFTTSGEEKNTLTNEIYCFDSNENTPEVVNLMLPSGALASGHNGNFFIVYQKSSARILEVFYAEKTGNYKYSFKTDDYDKLMGLRGDAQKDNRRSAKDFDGAVLGYYGGGDGLDKIDLAAPGIRVVNAETLKVIVTNPNVNTTNKPNLLNDVSLQLLITGKTSKAVATIGILDKGTKKDTTYFTDKDGNYEVLLDDITEAGKHFNVLFGEYANAAIFGSGITRLYPGEDLEIQAKAFSSTKLSNVAWSAIVTTNSLFADPYPYSGATYTEGTEVLGSAVEKGIIATANIRHLENLDQTLSSFAPSSIYTSYTSLEDKKYTAIQLSDFSWKGFREAINSGTPDDVSVNYGANNTAKSYYYPINPDYTDYKLTYDGQGHSISDVQVRGFENAGLFGTVVSGSKIKNLDLIDFNISGSNAGALAGTVTDAVAAAGSEATISNVLVRNTRRTGTDTDKDFEITGTASAGGLIGSMTGGSVDKCAAAVYVNGSTNAGGLIGSMDGTKLTDSYSGGHTLKGQYALDDEGEPVTSGAGRVNVTSTGNAGGLIGFAGNTGGNNSIKNCYSTCSVSGSSAAGGLIGNAFGTIENCYCTGLVVGDAELDELDDGGTVKLPLGKKHAFIGTGTATVKDSYYFSIVNDNYYADQNAKITDKAVQKKTPTELLPGCAGVQAFDAAGQNSEGTELTAAQMYNWFCKGSYDNSSTANSQPYDAQLTAQYAGKYFIRTIAELDNSLKNASGHLTAHFGDWPAPEILIFNTAG